MSVHATPATSSVSYDGCGEEDRGYGWAIFAGGLLDPASDEEWERGER